MLDTQTLHAGDRITVNGVKITLLSAGNGRCKLHVDAPGKVDAEERMARNAANAMSGYSPDEWSSFAAQDAAACNRLTLAGLGWIEGIGTPT